MHIHIKGAGIAGLLCAYMIKAQADFNVSIFDIVDPIDRSNASYVAGGMLAPYSEVEFLPNNFFQVGLEGIGFWQAHKEISTGFEKNGSILISHSEDRHMLLRIKGHLDEHNIDYKFLNRSDFQEHEEFLQERFESGIFVQGEGHLNPKETMNSLCQKLSDNFIDNEENPDWIIDCTGMGAQKKLTNLRGVKGETVVVRNPDFELRRPIRLMHPRYPLYIIPRGEGVFMIGATIIENSDNHVSLRSGMELMSALYSLHSSFGEAEILEINSGIRPAYDDNLPKIILDEDNRTIFVNGFFRHGYLLAPAMAQAVVDYLSGTRHKYWDLFTRDSNENNNQWAA